jgi:hypothetical protein
MTVFGRQVLAARKQRFETTATMKKGRIQKAILGGAPYLTILTILGKI